MFLIIEGMDNCGKSTLISSIRKNILKSTQTFSFHSSSPPEVENKNKWEKYHYTEMFEKMTEMSIYSDWDIIADRFHLGAYVYGKRYRNQEENIIEQIESSIFPDHAMPNNSMKSIALEYETILFVIVDETSSILKRDDGKSLESSVEELDETRMLFNSAFERSQITNKHLINLSKIGGIENLYSEVARILKNEIS